MPTPEITIGAYRGEPVGQGGFATVYRVSDNDRRIFALKLADPEADEAIRASLYHEFTVQSELIFPQVVHAHHFGLHNSRPYIVLDWVDGASLFEHFADSTSDDFVVMLRQIARVLLFIHHRGWVHGDLKPENFRWRASTESAASSELCLLDFGLARTIGDADRPRGAGTVGYCAPEFLNNLPADGRADWYSIGIILYEWIFGVRPFASDEPAIEIAGHLETAPDLGLPRRRQAPEWAIEVIGRLLAKSPEGRAEDEMSLLAWIAEFDHDLDPTQLLNQQLTWHAQSERRRLRPNGAELLVSLADELMCGLPAYWSIQANDTPIEPWLNRAAALCSSMGYQVAVVGEGESGFMLHDAVAAAHGESRIAIRVLNHEAASAIEPEIPQGRAVSQLPWDRIEIHSYLNGIIGDDDVASAWTETIHTATCGLPAAVGELLQHLVGTGALSVDADGWGLDESVIASWRDSHANEHIDGVFGHFDRAGLTLCQWLALGEGRGMSNALGDLWNESDGDFETTLTQMVSRGVIVRSEPESVPSFDLRLRLTGHDSIMRAGMMAEEVRDRSHLLAEAIERAHPVPESTRAEVLGHGYARAGMRDRSARECLQTATFAIKAEDRDRAMRYISMAQESARQIADATSRNHWMGQARMVEADLQKAIGQLEQARNTYRSLLALCRVHGDQRLLGETLHDLGDLYRMTRRYDKGIRAERRARRIWESLGDRAQLSRTLNSLGNFCRIACDYPEARNYYTAAIAIQKELGLEQYAATNLNNIGITHWLEYNFAEADSYFRDALAIQESLNVPVEIARVLNNLGAINFVQGRMDESAQYFTRAAALNASAGAQSEELYNRRNLVEVALEQGDLRAAVTLGQQVHHACGELGDVSTQAEVGALLADAYFRAGDYRSAQRMHAHATQLSASLRNDELRIYLSIQFASHLQSFHHDAEALAILDEINSAEPRIANRYQLLDVILLNMRIAAARDDSALIAHLLTSGLSEARTISAPHKAAQLAASRLGSTPGDNPSEELTELVDTFLTGRPRWHWTSAFRVWKARRLLLAGSLDAALEVVKATIVQLRRDGCWEQLWRALVLQGEICHAQADYEPAMRALDEAAHMLKVVLSTVDDESERAEYLRCEDARVLERVKERISELVA